MTFDYRDADGDTFTVTNNKTDAGQPVVWMSTSLDGVYVDLDHVEEVVAGIRDAARTAARQTTGQDNTWPLATPCGYCAHTLNWHVTGGRCRVTAGENGCGCTAFVAPDGSHPDTASQPDPAVVEQFIQHMATQHPAATHCCTNCDGIDPDTCLTNPGRPKDPTTADDPTPLRWGLGDVLHGDDDTVIVCLSGANREPYWLELDPERAAALRDDLTPPAGPQTALDRVRAVVEEWAQTAQRYPDSRLSTETVVFVLRTALAAPAVGQPAEAHDTNSSTWWTIQAQKPTGTWFNLSEGFSSADEARAWRDTEVAEPRNWQVRIVRVDQTETVAVEDER